MNEYQHISNYKDIIRQNTFCVIWKIINNDSIFKNNTITYTDSGIPYINAYFTDKITLAYDVYKNGVKKYNSKHKTINLSEYDSDVTLNINDIDNSSELISYIESNNAYVTNFLILLTNMPEVEKIEYTNDEIIYDEELKCNLLYMNELNLELNANVYFKDGTILDLFSIDNDIELKSSNIRNIIINNQNIIVNNLYDSESDVAYSYIDLLLENTPFSDVKNVPSRIKIICSSKNKTKDDLISYKNISNKLCFLLHNNSYDVEITDYNKIYSLINNGHDYIMSIFNRFNDVDTQLTGISNIEEVINEDGLSKVTIDQQYKTIKLNDVNVNVTLKITLDESIINLSEYDLESNILYINLLIENQIKDVKWNIYSNDTNYDSNDRIININRFLEEDVVLDTDDTSNNNDVLYPEENDQNYLEQNSDSYNYTDDDGLIIINDDYQLHLSACVYKQYIFEDDTKSEKILINNLDLFNLSNVKIENKDQLIKFQYIYGFLNKTNFEKYILKLFNKYDIEIEENVQYSSTIKVTLDNINDNRIKIDKQVFFVLQDDNSYDESKLMTWTKNTNEVLETNFEYNLDIYPESEIVEEFDKTIYDDYPYIKVSIRYSNSDEYTDISDKCMFEYDSSIIKLIPSNTSENIWFIKPLKVGECEIKLLNEFILVDSTSDSNYTESFNIIVRKVIEYINFNNYELSINVGDTKSISAIYYPTDATYPKLTWFSNDDSIASIDKKGIITGVSEGTAYIGLNEEDTKNYLPDFTGYTDEDGIVNIKILNNNELTCNANLQISYKLNCYIEKVVNNNSEIVRQLYKSDIYLNNCLVTVVNKDVFVNINNINIKELIDDVTDFQYDDDLSSLFDDENVEYRLIKEFKINISIEYVFIEDTSDEFKTLSIKDSVGYKKTINIIDYSNIEFNFLSNIDDVTEESDGTSKNDDDLYELSDEDNINSYFDNIWKYCVVRVNSVPLSSIELSSKSLLLDIAKTGSDSTEDVYVNLSPNNATYKNIIIELIDNYDSDEKEIINYIVGTYNDTKYIRIYPLREGNCKLKVYSENNDEVYDECNITVVDTSLKKITISGGIEDDDYEWYDDDIRIRTIERFADEDFPRYKLALNNSVQLLATLEPSGTVNTSLKWYSSNPKLVTCTEDGICTAIRYGEQELELYAEDNINVSDDADSENSDRYANTCWITCVSTDNNVSAVCQIRVFRNNITNIELEGETIESTDKDFIDDVFSYKRYDNTLDKRDDYYNYIMKVGEKINLPVKLTTQSDDFGASNNISWRGNHGFANGLDIVNGVINHLNAYDDKFDWNLKTPQNINDSKKELTTTIQANLIGEYDVYCVTTGKSGSINRDLHDGEYYSYGFPEESILNKNGQIIFKKHDLKVTLIYKGKLIELGTAVDQRQIEYDIPENGIRAFYNYNANTNIYYSIKYNIDPLKNELMKILLKDNLNHMFELIDYGDTNEEYINNVISYLTNSNDDEYLAMLNLIKTICHKVDNIFESYSYPISNENINNIKNSVLSISNDFSEDEKNSIKNIIDDIFSSKYMTNIDKIETIQNKIEDNIARIDSNNIIQINLPYQYEYICTKYINSKDESVISENVMYDAKFIPTNSYSENINDGKFEILLTNLKDEPVTGYMIELNGKKYSNDKKKIIDSKEYGLINNEMLTFPVKNSITPDIEFDYNIRMNEHPGYGMWRSRVKSNRIKIRVVAEDTKPILVVISGSKYVENKSSLARYSTNHPAQTDISQKSLLYTINNVLKINSGNRHRITIGLAYSKKFMQLLEDSKDNYSGSKLPQKWESFAWFTSDPNVFTLEEIQPDDLRDQENSPYYSKNTFENPHVYDKNDNLWTNNILPNNYFATSRMINIVPQGKGTAILTCKSIMGTTYISKKIIIV